MSRWGQDVIDAANEAVAIVRGERKPSRVFTPPSLDVASIRKKTGLSQQKFAQRYGFSPAAVRDWEQSRRMPEASARTLLIVIDREPAAVERALERS